MGVRISHPERLVHQADENSQNSTEFQKTSRQPSKTNEFQRNDNATKLMLSEKTSTLMGADYMSTSTASTISSRMKPHVGLSPQPYLHNSTRGGTRGRDFTHSWSRLSGSPSYNRTGAHRASTQTKPPWKPCVVKTHYDYSQAERPQSSLRQAPSPVPRQPRRMRRMDSRRVCSTSLSCLNDIHYQTGESHLRRCSAARRAQANKSEMLDTFSLENTHTLGIVEGTTATHRSRQPRRVRGMRAAYYPAMLRRHRPYPMTVANACGDSRQHRRVPSNILSDSLITAASESSFDIESIDPFTTVQDDTFPLRYVFYVEDKPKSMRAFANAGKVSLLARDTHCRVYFHAHIQRSANTNRVLGQTQNSVDSTQPVEPALYYHGKRVCPVTVAAPNLHALLRFVKQLDLLFPEFEASRYLSEQLVAPKRSGLETDSTQTENG
ncbi:unnamed protein product [Echinostoma caproni]|uniref:Uncharacterized protein n=1 Tax=Echinostoma caproni TaxID=27848 RepID=A0A183A8W6_9TREM|nr:unnamed protein product [Echinostoma caproni]